MINSGKEKIIKSRVLSGLFSQDYNIKKIIAWSDLTGREAEAILKR